jgi:hypothetical protein
MVMMMILYYRDLVSELMIWILLCTLVKKIDMFKFLILSFPRLIIMWLPSFSLRNQNDNIFYYLYTLNNKSCVLTHYVHEGMKI